MADSSAMLQELYLLASGRAASTATLNSINFISDTNGSAQIDLMINSHLNAQEAHLGTAALVQSIARSALGREIPASTATQVIADLNAAGLTTWAQKLRWVANNDTALTDTLDNRVEALTYFRGKIVANGTSGFFEGPQMTAAVTNELQLIGSSSDSLAAGKVNLDALASNLGPGGVYAPAGINTQVGSGYLASARVYADVNSNGVADTGEFSVLTTDGGVSTVTGTSVAGTLVATGGVDLFTAKPFEGVMTAPAGSSVITPLTTLVQSTVESGHSLLQANAAIRTALDLPAGINLLTYDPMRVLASSSATAQQRADAVEVLKASLQVSNIIAQVGNAIIATNGDLARDEHRDVAKALAVTLYASGSAGATFDLGSSTNLVDLLGQVNTGGAWSTYVDSLATITAASNNAVDAAQNIVDLSKSAVITQGSVPDAIAAGITTLTLGGTVTNYTGAYLDTRIDAAEPGSVTPGVTASMADALTVVGVPPATTM